MSSASKVAEIFVEAGAAFSKLGELTKQLNSSTDQTINGGSWTDQEVAMLQTTVSKFSDDLSKIAEIIKNRTLSQTYNHLKKKAVEKSGLRTLFTTQENQSVRVQPDTAEQHVARQAAESEKNLLETNASEDEVDVEELLDLQPDDGTNLL